MSSRVAVIGAGISGSCIAVELQKAGLDVTLIEKGREIVNGPPACHLHAGGNLYPEICIEDAKLLLKHSIEFARHFTLGINRRPTLFCIPKDVSIDVDKMVEKVDVLKEYYQECVRADEKNGVLGSVEEYFTLYSKERVLELYHGENIQNLTPHDRYLQNSVKKMDLERVKFPLIMVSEPGISLFRVASLLEEALRTHSVKCLFESECVSVEKQKNGYLIKISSQESVYEERFDFVVNAAGYESKMIDCMVGVYEPESIELKSAYIVECHGQEALPEIIFHGIRSTPKGMGQLTPNCGGFFQLHSMTLESTLFEEGIRAFSEFEPISLPSEIERLVNKGFFECEVQKRTQSAVEHIQRFIPSFTPEMKLYKPLYGIQKISQGDVSKRTGGAKFYGSYVSVELVKYSSVISISREIVKAFTGRELQINEGSILTQRECEMQGVTIAKRRGYPMEIAQFYPKF